MKWLRCLVGPGPAALRGAAWVAATSATCGVHGEGHFAAPGSREGIVFCATHHTGALDFLAAYPVLAARFPRLRIVVNPRLMRLAQLAPIAIPSRSARAEMAAHLEAGGNLLVFPAGRVGHRTLHGLQDSPWKRGVAEVIQSSARASYPVYIGAEGPPLLYWLRERFRRLGPLTLLWSLTRFRGGRVPVYVGAPIERTAARQVSPDELLRTLRTSAYALPPRQVGAVA